MLKKNLYLVIYYLIARYLPSSYMGWVGRVSNALRVVCCKRIFKSAGKIITVDRGAYFGNGRNVVIGDYSGISANCVLPSNIIIGNYVMMAPDLLALKNNHRFDRPDIPISRQGDIVAQPIVIGDNVWIGQRVIITPGTRIASGSVVAAGAVVTREHEPDSIIGGNPARVIRSRIAKS